MSENITLDIDLLNDYKTSLGIDLLTEMLDLYINQSAIYLADIKLAACSDDNEVWHEKCHKMKGAASSAGLVTLRAYLVEIEHSKAEQQTKDSFCQQLTMLNNEAIKTFKAWLQQ